MLLLWQYLKKLGFNVMLTKIELVDLINSYHNKKLKKNPPSPFVQELEEISTLSEGQEINNRFLGLCKQKTTVIPSIFKTILIQFIKEKAAELEFTPTPTDMELFIADVLVNTIPVKLMSANELFALCCENKQIEQITSRNRLLLKKVMDAETQHPFQQEKHQSFTECYEKKETITPASHPAIAPSIEETLPPQIGEQPNSNAKALQLITAALAGLLTAVSTGYIVLAFAGLGLVAAICTALAVGLLAGGSIYGFFNGLNQKTNTSDFRGTEALVF